MKRNDAREFAGLERIKQRHAEQLREFGAWAGRYFHMHQPSANAAQYRVTLLADASLSNLRSTHRVMTLAFLPLGV